jgi:HEAT repeat protein
MEMKAMQTMKKNKQDPQDPQQPNVAELISKLGSRNGVERQYARATLVALGEPAVGPLIAALSSDRSVMRWEAAKAFVELHAERAASALVKALEDEDCDVRWLAAEALVGLADAGLVSLFEALMAHADSIALREGAHHVLRALNHGERAEIITPVLTTLEHYEPELAVPFSAEVALGKLARRDD